MKLRVTIKEVAKEAGVSIASVSHFLNKKKEKYSEDTGKKILQAIIKLGYEIDINARVLASGKSNIIGLVLPITYKSTTSTILLRENPFYSELYDGISHVAYERNYDIIISGFDQPEKCISWIKRRKLDGLIIVGMQSNFINTILKNNLIPIVMIDMEEKKDSRILNIKTDDESSIDQAINYLIQCGHKNIAYASGFLSGSYVNKSRFKGYKEALQNKAINYKQEYFFENYTSFEGGYQMGEQIMQQKLPVTAILTSSDIIAYGIMRYFIDHKIKIPQDISLIGFDDLKICTYTSPLLTTIKQNIEAKGIIAAKNIIDEINNNRNIVQTIIVPSELIIRETVKKI